MPNTSQNLSNAAIAATSWVVDGKPNIRVYTQDVRGGIRETRWNPINGWSGGTSKDVIAYAQKGSPIAAINFKYRGRLSVHVYYLTHDLNQNNHSYIKEIYQDGAGGWNPGSLNRKQVAALPHSGLAIIGTVLPDLLPSIFYRRPDGAINEITLDYYDDWLDLGVVPTKVEPRYIRSMTALTFRPTSRIRIRLFYQSSQNDIFSLDKDESGNWLDRGNIGGLKALSNSAGLVALNANGSTRNHDFHLLYIREGNTLIERTYKNERWQAEKYPGQIMTSYTIIAAVPVQPAGSLRAYVQIEDGRIQELLYHEGTTDWAKGCRARVKTTLNTCYGRQQTFRSRCRGVSPLYRSDLGG